MKYVVKSFATIGAILLAWVVYYTTLPTLSIAHLSGALYIGFDLILLVAVICMWASNSDNDRLIFIPIVVVGAVVVIIIAIGAIASLTLFHADAMRNQLGDVKDVEYTEMIQQIDTSQIPIVDKKLAKKQADKKIGQDVALGSRAELDKGAIQNVNGEITWVFPLKHTGFWKWHKNRTTPGYITVSASNPNKVTYVTEIDGEKVEVKYSNSSFFSCNLKRHIRNSGYRNVGLTEYTFELNNEGRPYWVVTAYKNTTIWSNPEAVGTIVVDAQTGEVEYYSIKDTPDWVDIIQPKEFIEDQLDNWGKLVHGVFNFSDEDKIEKTDRTLTVYVDGDCYYFTGMTSVGADNSCVGFIMVNTRDKKTMMAKMSGATENAAMSSAEGLVSDFGYKSTEPLPLNVSGIPTYVMALKDDEGLIKSYAMVNIDNYSISANGSTLAETSKNYLQAVTKNSSIDVVASDEAYGYDINGTIARISSEVQDGSTQYYIVLEEMKENIFTASYAVSEELSITQVGDQVKVYYLEDSNGTIEIMSFDNLSFSESVSEAQEERDKMDEGTSALDSEKNEVYDVKPEESKDFWDDLSEEDKAKFIKEFGSKEEKEE